LKGKVDPRSLKLWDHKLGCPPLKGKSEAEIAAIKEAYMPGPVAKIYQMYVHTSEVFWCRRMN